MKSNRLFCSQLLAVVLSCAGLVGCQKKQTSSAATDQSAPATPAAVAETAASPAPASPGSSAAPAPAAIAPSFTAVDMALKSRDYDKAAQTLIAVQKQKLTE